MGISLMLNRSWISAVDINKEVLVADDRDDIDAIQHSALGMFGSAIHLIVMGATTSSTPLV